KPGGERAIGGHARVAGPGERVGAEDASGTGGPAVGVGRQYPAAVARVPEPGVVVLHQPDARDLGTVGRDDRVADEVEGAVRPAGGENEVPVAVGVAGEPDVHSCPPVSDVA